MRKTHYRDYATEAFRFWAVEGPAEKYKQRLWEEAVQRQNRIEGGSGISCPSEAAIIRTEQELEDAEATIADLEAVDKTLVELQTRGNGAAIMEALRVVYMDRPDRELEPGDISARVHKAELTIPASERSIFNWLALARRTFARERKLRL